MVFQKFPKESIVIERGRVCVPEKLYPKIECRYLSKL
jgi:hypothetical protein